MGKIVGIVLPNGREAELQSLLGRLRPALSFVPDHVVEEDCYRGSTATCVLLRVGPDPINVSKQPIANADWAGVMCGYYFSGETDKKSLNANGALAEPAGTLLQDIDQDSVDNLTHGDGVYAFVRWNIKKESLLAGVDKLGMRPLYWAELPAGGFVVASEPKAIVCLFDQPSPNWLAWQENLTFSHVFGNHTLFEGVSRLGPAETCVFSEGRYSLSTLESFLGSIEIRPRSVDEFLEEQSALFDASMSRLTTLYPAAAQSMLTLSGGYDSRRMFAWLIQNNITPQVYTVPEVLPDGREYESGLVRELCLRAGVEGWCVYPDTAEQLAQIRTLRNLLTDFQSGDHIFTTMLAMSLSCFDKVNFDGLAAGVALGGVFVKKEYLETGGNETFMGDWPAPINSWLLPPGNLPDVFARARSWLESWGDNPNRFSYFYLLSRTRCRIGLAPLAFQTNGFESVYPYLGRDMMRSAFSFPPEKKIHAHLQRALIARLDTAISDVPTTHDHIENIPEQYFRHLGQFERQQKFTLLKQMRTIGKRIHPWKAPVKQQVRFVAASVLKEALDPGFFNWEAGKAGQYHQLEHFLRVTASGKDYLDAVTQLDEVFGSRPQWCRPL